MAADLSHLTGLEAELRADAAVLREYGAAGQAQAVDHCADRITERLREWQLEALTLEQAADERGIRYSGAQKKVARGDWPNVGRPHAPRVPRWAVLGLPPPESEIRLETGEPDVAEKVLRARTAR